MSVNTATIGKVLRILRSCVRQWKVPAVGMVAAQAADRPFETLISTMLSLRTKDDVTERASRRLLSRAPTPQAIAALPIAQIETLIYPAGFYHTKAKNLRETARILLRDHGGRVPRRMEELLQLPGVGRKTANLVITVGYGGYGICVDTHVHRISNRWAYVQTRTPAQTESALYARLPRRYWKTYNDLLVTFGQNLCLPISPRCSQCPVARYCKKVGVSRHR